MAMTRDEAIAALAALGFTEQFDEGENGDSGPRLYFCRPGSETNQHGRPLDTAQADCWGGGRWTTHVTGAPIDPAAILEMLGGTR